MPPTSCHQDLRAYLNNQLLDKRMFRYVDGFLHDETFATEHLPLEPISINP